MVEHDSSCWNYSNRDAFASFNWRLVNPYRRGTRRKRRTNKKQRADTCFSFLKLLFVFVFSFSQRFNFPGGQTLNTIEERLQTMRKQHPPKEQWPKSSKSIGNTENNNWHTQEHTNFVVFLRVLQTLVFPAFSPQSISFLVALFFHFRSRLLAATSDQRWICLIVMPSHGILFSWWIWWMAPGWKTNEVLWSDQLGSVGGYHEIPKLRHSNGTYSTTFLPKLGGIQ